MKPYERRNGNAVKLKGLKMKLGALFVACGSLLGAIALVLTTPINRWLMAKGKGHAVVRAHH